MTRTTRAFDESVASRPASGACVKKKFFADAAMSTPAAGPYAYPQVDPRRCTRRRNADRAPDRDEKRLRRFAEGVLRCLQPVLKA